MKRVLLPLLLFTACHSSSADAPVTFWADIAPTLSEKCARCHQAGGIGPFAVLDYAAVAARAPKLAAMTKSREMPPFHIAHDGTCGNFQDAEALTQAEIDRIQLWATAGTLVEGTAVDLTPPRPPALEGGTELRTPVVTPVAAGTPVALFDEYRCFPMDTALTHDQFITAYEILPGQPAIVHHLIGFVIDPDRKTKSGPTNRALMQALDAKDPDRPGWPCFGGAGDGLEEESAPLWWAPGLGPVTFPDRIGIRQRTGDQVVVQIHYNLADAKNRGLSDSTTVRIRYEDSVGRQGLVLGPDGFLETLFTKDPPDELEAARPSVKYTWKKSMAEMGLGMVPPLEVIAVGPHMHERGRSSELHFLNAGGRDDCAARAVDWNFHWQRMYFYAGTRPVLGPDTSLQLTCEYDTSADLHPVLPGWGTRNEMCLDALLVAPVAQ